MTFGTLLYSYDSPLATVDLSLSLRMLLMGAAVALTTFLIIRSPFGRQSGAHFNQAITLTYFWLRRVHERIYEGGANLRSGIDRE